MPDGDEAQVEGVLDAVGILLAIGSNEFFDRESERLEALGSGMKRVINVVKDEVVDTVETDYLIFRDADTGAKQVCLTLEPYYRHSVIYISLV